MAEVPEGAQLSADGHYWWDEDTQQWQLVDDSAGLADGDDRAAARVAAGLPASLHQLTAEQLVQHLAEPTILVEEPANAKIDVPELDLNADGEAAA
jgi:hypothetical protein